MKQVQGYGQLCQSSITCLTYMQPTSDRIGIESNADPGRKEQNEQRESESLHLLKEENLHLKRLIASLNKEVEMWREISRSPHHTAG